MTFKELKAWIDTLTPEQLEAEVLAYSSVIDDVDAISSVGFNSTDKMGELLESIEENAPLLFLEN